MTVIPGPWPPRHQADEASGGRLVEGPVAGWCTCVHGEVFLVDGRCTVCGAPDGSDRWPPPAA